MRIVAFEIFTQNEHRQLIEEGEAKFVFSDEEARQSNNALGQMLIGNECKVKGITLIIDGVIGDLQLIGSFRR